MKFSKRQNGRIMTNIRVTHAIGLDEAVACCWYLSDQLPEELGELTRAKVIDLCRTAYMLRGHTVNEDAWEIEEGYVNHGRIHWITEGDVRERLEELFPEFER